MYLLKKTSYNKKGHTIKSRCASTLSLHTNIVSMLVCFSYYIKTINNNMNNKIIIKSNDFSYILIIITSSNFIDLRSTRLTSIKVCLRHISILKIVMQITIFKFYRVQKIHIILFSLYAFFYFVLSNIKNI